MVAKTELIDQSSLDEIEHALGGRFETNPFVSDQSPFFPCRCLSHGCAEWAVKISSMFVDDFFNRMGMTTPLDEVRGDLQTR